LKFFDLYAGIGGFRLGMERNGHECIGSCEIDKYAREIYAKNFGHKPKYEDATKLNPEELPDFQCLCAGFPCQSFSSAGRRRGFEDTRGTLFFEIVRIAREKQPSILFLENVKGLLSHDKGKTYRIIIQTLDELGYDCEWQLVNSKYFVPQNRDRIFIIGHLRESGRSKILPLGKDSRWDIEPQGKTREKGKRVRSTHNKHTRTIDANYWKGGSHGSLIKEPNIKMIKNSGENLYRIYSVDGVSRSLTSNPGGMGKNTGVYAEPKIKKSKSLWKGQSGNVYDTDGIAPSLCSSDATRGFNASGYIEEKKKTMIYTSNTNANMKRRIQDRNETWTLTGNSNDFALLDDYRIRRLTPTECERLQGFPDNWTKHKIKSKDVSDTQRYKCLGNAVTVTVIEYIGGLL
jgi:DNA (cytosine-5)-methyltransferase 1